MRQEKIFTVYLMTNTRRGVFYVGMSSALTARVAQHKEGKIPGFTSKWGLKRLVWFQQFEDAHSAIAFEKKLKKWKRLWKFDLVEKNNPEWDDLWPALIGKAGDGASGGPE